MCCISSRFVRETRLDNSMSLALLEEFSLAHISTRRWGLRGINVIRAIIEGLRYIGYMIIKLFSRTMRGEPVEEMPKKYAKRARVSRRRFQRTLRSGTYLLWVYGTKLPKRTEAAEVHALSLDINERTYQRLPIACRMIRSECDATSQP
jgi:hypothetical protein